MSGFEEFFRNEKRIKTINFLKNVFGSIFSKKAWYFIAFWVFLFITFYTFYKTLTFKNKFPVECGKIINFEILTDINGKNVHHFFVETPNGIEDKVVIESIYNKYLALQKTNPESKYCESYTDNLYVFEIFLIFLFSIITIVYLVCYCSEY